MICLHSWYKEGGTKGEAFEIKSLFSIELVNHTAEVTLTIDLKPD